MDCVQPLAETEEQDLLGAKRSYSRLFSLLGYGKGSDRQLSFKRPVLELKKGISEHQWELQQVELNSLRIGFVDLVDFYGESFVLLGFITLFASAFPLGPIIALVNSIVDSRYEIYEKIFSEANMQIDLDYSHS